MVDIATRKHEYGISHRVSGSEWSPRNVLVIGKCSIFGPGGLLQMLLTMYSFDWHFQ